jgi:hypothetical protein
MKICKYIIDIEGIKYEQNTYPDNSDVEELIYRWAEDSGKFMKSDITSIKVYSDYAIIKTSKNKEVQFEVYNNPVYNKAMQALELQDSVEKSIQDGTIRPSKSFIR